MSIRGIVKKIFPKEAWPYLQIPYRMCWAIRRKAIRAFTNRKIIAEARKYIPYYQDELSLRVFNDRIEYLRSQDMNIFVRRAKSDGWKFSELYEIPSEKYSCITVVCGNRKEETQYLRSMFELMLSPPEHRFITLKEFLAGEKVDALELLVFTVSDWEYIKVEKYIARKGLTNDTTRELFAVREEYQYVDVFRPVEDEVIVDAGAYVGDTALRFVKYTNGGGGHKLRRIYSFEPEAENAAKYRENLKDFADKVTLIQAGTWDKEEMSSMFGSGSGGIITESGSTKIQLTTIDKAVGDDKVTFIKMDVEGSELKSLIGAQNTIRKNHPRLAICVYHKPEDIYAIPEYLLSLVPEYRFYLRHYSSNPYETVLYAEVPK